MSSPQWSPVWTDWRHVPAADPERAVTLQGTVSELRDATPLHNARVVVLCSDVNPTADARETTPTSFLQYLAGKDGVCVLAATPPAQPYDWWGTVEGTVGMLEEALPNRAVMDVHRGSRGARPLYGLDGGFDMNKLGSEGFDVDVLIRFAEAGSARRVREGTTMRKDELDRWIAANSDHPAVVAARDAGLKIVGHGEGPDDPVLLSRSSLDWLRAGAALDPIAFHVGNIAPHRVAGLVGDQPTVVACGDGERGPIDSSLAFADHLSRVPAMTVDVRCTNMDPARLADHLASSRGYPVATDAPYPRALLGRMLADGGDVAEFVARHRRGQAAGGPGPTPLPAFAPGVPGPPTSTGPTGRWRPGPPRGMSARRMA